MNKSVLIICRFTALLLVGGSPALAFPAGIHSAQPGEQISRYGEILPNCWGSAKAFEAFRAGHSGWPAPTVEPGACVSTGQAEGRPWVLIYSQKGCGWAKLKVTFWGESARGGLFRADLPCGGIVTVSPDPSGGGDPLLHVDSSLYRNNGGSYAPTTQAALTTTETQRGRSVQPVGQTLPGQAAGVYGTPYYRLPDQGFADFDDTDYTSRPPKKAEAAKSPARPNGRRRGAPSAKTSSTVTAADVLAAGLVLEFTEKDGKLFDDCDEPAAELERVKFNKDGQVELAFYKSFCSVGNTGWFGIATRLSPGNWVEALSTPGSYILIPVAHGGWPDILVDSPGCSGFYPIYSWREGKYALSGKKPKSCHSGLSTTGTGRHR